MCGSVQSIARIECILPLPAERTMFEPPDDRKLDPAQAEKIFRAAPAGALTIAGIATAIVFGLWLMFYLLVFLPRGMLH